MTLFCFQGCEKLRDILLLAAIIATGLFMLENFINSWLVKNQLACPWCYWAHHQLTSSITATTIKKTPTPELLPNSLKILCVIFNNIVVLAQRRLMHERQWCKIICPKHKSKRESFSYYISFNINYFIPLPS